MSTSIDTAPQTAQAPGPVSRRTLLGRAAAAAAAAGVATVAVPAAALAANSDPVLAGATTLAEGITSVKYDGAAGFTDIVFLANATAYGADTSIYSAACGGWAGKNDANGGNGVVNGVYGFTDSGSGNGVIGRNSVSDGASGGAGVLGVAANAGAFGVRAIGSNGGTALKVEGGQAIFDQTVAISGAVSVAGVANLAGGASFAGRTSFARSGRAIIPKNRAYVDVTVSGGLGATANVLATLQQYKLGVYVAACRRDYPTAGKARIYLNKVASKTAGTAVAWFVTG